MTFTGYVWATLAFGALLLLYATGALFAAFIVVCVLIWASIGLLLFVNKLWPDPPTPYQQDIWAAQRAENLRKANESYYGGPRVSA